MFAAFHPVAGGRIRESVGLPFESFSTGQTFHHRPGITVSQEENANEALATLNQAALHYDAHYAGATEFGRPLVVSTLTLQRAIGLGWKTFGRRRRILGFSDIRLLGPVFGGDTLYARTRIVDIRPDPEGRDCGIVESEATVTRADGNEVAVVCFAQEIYRDGRGPFEALGYAAGGGDPAAYPAHVAIGDDAFVETLGIEFDAFTPGLVIEHRPGFTFSWAEARYRAALAGDHAPVVVDPMFAREAGGGQAEISQPWLVGVFAATTTRAFGRVVANLAWQNVTFANPIRDGDTVFAESEILGKRVSGSRPDQGIVHMLTRGVVRGGDEVCRYERKLLVYRSAEGPHRAAGYV